MTEGGGGGRKTPEERKELLSRAIQSQLAEGKRRVETRSDYDAVIVKPKRINMGVGAHLFLAFFTAGIWLIVWLILAIVDKETRFMITVDEYGNTPVAEIG